MDEPRTHLVLRELVQLVHLPLVVVPHGPGRARARTASRGAGPSERCRTSNSSGCFLFHYSERLRNVRVSCSLRLHPHTWCSRFEPLTGLTKIPYHSSTGVAQKLWCIFVYGTPRSTAFPNASKPQRRVARAVMGMGSQNDTESIPDLAAGVEVRDGMVRASPRTAFRHFALAREYPRRGERAPSKCDAEGDPLLPTPVG